MKAKTHRNDHDLKIEYIWPKSNLWANRQRYKDRLTDRQSEFVPWERAWPSICTQLSSERRTRLFIVVATYITMYKQNVGIGQIFKV